MTSPNRETEALTTRAEVDQKVLIKAGVKAQINRQGQAGQQDQKISNPKPLQKEISNPLSQGRNVKERQEDSLAGFQALKILNQKMGIQKVIPEKQELPVTSNPELQGMGTASLSDQEKTGTPMPRHLKEEVM